MKRLFLLRHAKAGFGTSDQNRPLSPRGKREALWLGDYLKKKDLLPDYIICSSANRTKETYSQLLGENRDISHKVPPANFRDDFYLASADHILHHIKSLEPTVKAVMIIGHNPGLSKLFQYLAHNPPQDSRSLKYPTCTLGILDFEIEDWSDLKTNTAQVIKMVIPSDRIKPSDEPESSDKMGSL